MKKKSLLIIISSLLVFSCQKEIHWEIEAEGYLQKDSIGNCLPVSVSGNYVAGSAVSSDNFITVDINVTSLGTYNVLTDSINGYVFKASGKFQNTGINQVKLTGTGTPTVAGIDHFNVRFDTSSCEVAVTVKSNAVSVAKYSLQGAPGKCLNDSVTGRYVKEVPLDTSETVNLTVIVISPGRYDIVTDVVNGYSFYASGTFVTTGVQTVPMHSKGTPVKEGTDMFHVVSDSSSCNLEILVRSDEAEFTLEGAPGNCLGDSVMGTFVKGIYLDTFSKVDINVNVVSPGKYTLHTDTVNGYSFTIRGVFIDPGIQTLRLYAEGQPVNEGTDVFHVTGGPSACSFEVIVLSDFVTVTNDDYFPLTDSSYWIYDDLYARGNTIKRSITGKAMAAGKEYSMMQETDNYGIIGESLFRKNNPDYFEYAKPDKYTGAFKYGNTELTDLLFLNQFVQQGNSWESPEFSDTTTFNQVIFLKYAYECIKSNAPVAINGKVFANVNIIEMRPQLHTAGNPWGSTNEIYTYFYAKGVGLIYYNAISNYGFKKAEMQLKSWLVK